jgi:hypothetical protein
MNQHFVTMKASGMLKYCTVDVEGSNALQLSAIAVLGNGSEHSRVDCRRESGKRGLERTEF